MTITQLSVFLENSPGRLARLAQILGSQNINMHALTIADTSDFGVARIICDRPNEAAQLLSEENMSAHTTQVCAVEIPDTPGGLGKLLEFLAINGVDIGYTYCFVEPKTSNAISVMKLGDPASAVSIAQGGYRLLTDDDLSVQF